MSKTELFISKAIKIHKDRYDYSKVKYINAKTKILITCKIHGEFEQTPNNHITKKQNATKLQYLNPCKVLLQQ